MKITPVTSISRQKDAIRLIYTLTPCTCHPLIKDVCRLGDLGLVTLLSSSTISVSRLVSAPADISYQLLGLRWNLLKPKGLGPPM